MQYTSFQFFQLAWDGQALLHRANLTCFCIIDYILKAASLTFLFRDFLKHDFKALCHVGCFLSDHKFCYIIQQLEQNTFLQGCGKYLDRAASSSISLVTWHMLTQLKNTLEQGTIIVHCQLIGSHSQIKPLFFCFFSCVLYC